MPPAFELAPRDEDNLMPLYSEPNRYPFFVRVQGKLAGFVMIRVNRGRFEVAEYKGHRLSLHKAVAFLIAQSFRSMSDQFFRYDRIEYKEHFEKLKGVVHDAARRSG